jgi:hypothetical protein
MNYPWRKLQLAELARPSSLAAIPNWEKTAAGFAADRGAAQVQEQQTANQEQQRTDILSEKSRQQESKLADHRRYMDDWEKQNKWATAIGVMNLAAQGVSAWDQTKKLDAQQANQQKLMDLEQEKVDLQRIAIENDRKRLQPVLSGLGSEHPSIKNRRKYEMPVSI